MIALMVILTVIILAVSIGGLITVYLYYRYRQHKIEDARKKELQVFIINIIYYKYLLYD